MDTLDMARPEERQVDHRSAFGQCTCSVDTSLHSSRKEPTQAHGTVTLAFIPIKEPVA